MVCYVSNILDARVVDIDIPMKEKGNSYVTPYSSIETWLTEFMDADYVITDGARRIAIYVFLAKDGESCYVTRSLFRDARDYTEGQHRFTILHKEKINIKTGENKVLFSSLENK